MNALCCVNEGSAEPTHQFRLSTSVPLTLVDPRGNNGEGEFSAELGPREAVVFKNAEGRPEWFVFPTLGFRGLRKDKWVELWENTDVRVEVWDKDGWRDADEKDFA